MFSLFICPYWIEIDIDPEFANQTAPFARRWTSKHIAAAEREVCLESCRHFKRSYTPFIASSFSLKPKL
jgi:hypothetical protein